MPVTEDITWKLNERETAQWRGKDWDASQFREAERKKAFAFAKRSSLGVVILSCNDELLDAFPKNIVMSVKYE